MRGKYHAGPGNTERDLTRLIAYFGKTKLLTEITDSDVTKLVAWRRGHKRPDGTLIASDTVNRSTTGQLRTLFAFVKAEGVQFDQEPQWHEHMMTKPEERYANCMMMRRNVSTRPRELTMRLSLTL